MFRKLFFVSALLVAVFAAAHCSNDNNTITGPPFVTATPSPGPGTPTVTPGAATMTPTPTGPTMTPTPGPAIATVNVGPNGGFVFVDQASGTNTTTIVHGSTVHWVWQSGPHSSTSGTCSVGCTPDGNWDSGIQVSGTFDHTFPTAGSFPYYCQVHGAMMTGLVVVQ